MLDALEKQPRRRVMAAIDALVHEPRPAGCVKLAGSGNAWRVRVGDYRVVYEVHDAHLLVLVVDLGHRAQP